jgi:hypothetical protein
LASFNIDVADLGVSSDVFMQTTQVLMLERIYQLKSIIRRDENSAVVIARSQNNF